MLVFKLEKDVDDNHYSVLQDNIISNKNLMKLHQNALLQSKSWDIPEHVLHVYHTCNTYATRFRVYEAGKVSFISIFMHACGCVALGAHTW